MKIVLYINQIDQGSREEQPKLNAENRALVERSVELAQSCGGEVFVLAAGGEKEKTLLREALARGCAQASLILAEEEHVMLAEKVAETIRQIGYDLIVTGYRTLDGLSSYIGPQIAEYLNLPQISFAGETLIREGKLYAKRNLDDCVQQMESALPCLLTFSNSAAETRTLSVMNIIKACEKKIGMIAWGQEHARKDVFYQDIKTRSVTFAKKECEMHYTIEVENETGKPVQHIISATRAAHIIYDQIRERGLIS